MPHYVATPPNPLATGALLDRLGTLVDAPFPLTDLHELAAAWRRRVDEIVADDDDVRTYVTQLESRYDDELSDDVDLPSGETIAAEFERYLRDQGPGR